MENIIFVKSSLQYAKSYCKTVDTVAKEKKYLATTEGFPIESTIIFVDMIVKNNLSQFYAIYNDEVVGWCDILPKSAEEKSCIGTLGMGILAEYRHKGLGTRLLLLAINHAKKFNGIEKVELEVFKSNTSAINFYKKMGFKIEVENENTTKLRGALQLS